MFSSSHSPLSDLAFWIAFFTNMESIEFWNRKTMRSQLICQALQSVISTVSLNKAASIMLEVQLNCERAHDWNDCMWVDSQWSLDGTCLVPHGFLFLIQAFQWHFSLLRLGQWPKGIQISSDRRDCKSGIPPHWQSTEKMCSKLDAPSFPLESKKLYYPPYVQIGKVEQKYWWLGALKHRLKLFCSK